MLIDLQRLLHRALTGEAPLDVIRKGAPSLSPEDRAALDRIDPDGVRMAGLLVRKLRFERVCRGDAEFASWFEQDPAAFSELFGMYVKEVPPREFFPLQEAAAFRAWLDSRR